MAGSSSPGRPNRMRPEAIAAAVLVVVTLTTALVLQPWNNAGSGSGASPSPGGSPGAASPSPTGSPDGQWSDIDLQPIAAVATLAASKGDEAGVAPDATFALTSLTGDTAITLAGRVEVSPTADFDVRTTSDTTQVTLDPTAALKAGGVYRFTLRGADGSLAASWAFRVRSPLHVIGTLPGDHETSVPTRTGIEVTFDQEGVADIQDWFSISPAVKGRFERHGRTQVFVPDGLAEKTLYTVTIKAGLPRGGTDLTLEKDVVFRFETQGKDALAPYLKTGRDVVETSPSEAPVIGVEAVVPAYNEEEDPAIPTTADVKVYRLPSLDAAADVLADFLAAPRWTEHSYPLIPTDGLPLVTTFTADVQPLATERSGAIRFPEALPKGWYVVELQGDRPSQTFLQVTPVSAWVSVLTDRTVVWVNDVVTTKPMKGATAAVRNGAALGTADADGLVVAPTPTVLLPPAEANGATVPDVPPLLTVRSPAGDTVLVPFEVGWNGGIYRGEWWEKTTSADARFWSLLDTDRTLYRQTDTVEAWGYLRGRDDDTVPSSVQLRLVPNDSSVADPPGVARASATPAATGAFTAALTLVHVPLGTYHLEAVVDGRVVARRWVEVDVIRKPAYRLAVTTDHTAVITGSKVRWTTTATFFDGSPVPSLGVNFNEKTLTTSAAGTVSVDLAAPPPDEDETSSGATDWDLGAMPAQGEEGEINDWASVLVFPSSYHLDAEGTLDGSRLEVTGAVDAVDLAKVEAKQAAGTWDGDPDGAPVGGATVKAVVTELVPVRHLVGTYYDFIEKIARPEYEYDTQRRAVDTLTVRSGSNGRFSFHLAVPDPKHEYEVRITTSDGRGLVERQTITAGSRADLWSFNEGIQFEPTSGAAEPEHGYGIGDSLAWRMTDDGTPIPADPVDRYLYLVAQRGLRSATVSDSPTFERTFTAADAPRIFIIGVRFTGATYAPKAASWADFDESERAIKVAVTTDRDRYRPGEDVTFSVMTTDARGRPIAADVVFQAVDEKLYAMGGAATPQPLEDLYAPVDSGIVRLTATHQVPVAAGPEGEGGDTTGGEGRDDFRDTLAFSVLRTNATGKATLTVKLSDDLTSWHIAASAVTADLRAGVGELLVPVALPLFVDATIADEYLLADRPIIRLRAYGEALKAGDPVEFTVSSPSLGLAATKVAGTAFEPVAFELPALKLGTQKLDISVIAPTRTDAAGKALADRLIRTFGVVRSRFTAAQTAYLVLGEPLPSVGGDEAATYTFTDAGRGRYVPILVSLSDPPGARIDRGLAQAIALDLLTDSFGRDPATLPVAAFDPAAYELGMSEDDSGVRRGGLALLPYGGTDPWLAARVAIMAPDKMNASQLREVLLSLRDLDSTQRDLWIACTAGLAALGEAVLPDLQEARAATDLTVTEQLYLALGYAAVGDDASALAIERALLEAHGQELGASVRLDVGSLDESAEATALLAVLAAGLGDPLAPAMVDYVVAHPSHETTHALDVAEATRRALARTPSTAASFAYTVDGQRTVVRLAAGESVTLSLSPAQRTGLALEPVTGKVGLAIAWREAVDVASLEPDPLLSLTRHAPASVPADDLVTVTLTAAYTATALDGCYAVVEEVPSGLAPLRDWGGRVGGGGDVIWPSSVVGQRVTFCVSKPDAQGALSHELRYVARVIGAGTYVWEPAVMQAEGFAESAAVTGASTLRIGD